MIQCKRCKKQYIGETKRTLRERFKEHIDRHQTIHTTQTPQQQSLPTLIDINLATRSQTWNLFRWNYNPHSACHAVRQEKRTS